MKNFRPTLKRLWLWWLILITAVAIFGYLAVKEFQRWWNLREDVVRTEQGIETTQERLTELSEELTLISDPVYLEKEARRNLNVKREGEEVLVVVGLDEVKQVEHFSLASPSRIEEGSEMWENVRSWWSYFFGEAQK